MKMSGLFPKALIAVTPPARSRILLPSRFDFLFTIDYDQESTQFKNYLAYAQKNNQ